MGTYVAGGAVGTLASLYWANLGRGNITAHSVGASAAIWAIAVLYCLITDQETIKLPFIKDMEVSFWPKSLITAFVAWEIYTAAKKGGKAPHDHASHFGGILVGGSVAGYLHVNGFHQRRAASQGVQEAAGVDAKTIDVGAMVKEEVKEVKTAVSKVVKKE